MLIDLVMVTAPKPPGSRTSISPAGAVFEMAPAKVLHGAVRLHGLASSPTPETQVRVACACAGAMARPATKSVPRSAEERADFVIMITPLVGHFGSMRLPQPDVVESIRIQSNFPVRFHGGKWPDRGNPPITGAIRPLQGQSAHFDDRGIS